MSRETFAFSVSVAVYRCYGPDTIGLGFGRSRAGREDQTVGTALPADTLASASVADLPGAIERWKHSGMRPPLANPCCGPSRNASKKILPQLLHNRGLDWNELLSLPVGEACMAVVPGKGGRPAVVIAMEVGDRREKAEKFFWGLGAAAKNPVVHAGGDLQIQQTAVFTYFVRDGFLVAATDPARDAGYGPGVARVRRPARRQELPRGDAVAAMRQRLEPSPTCAASFGRSSTWLPRSNRQTCCGR